MSSKFEIGKYYRMEHSHLPFRLVEKQEVSKANDGFYVGVFEVKYDGCDYRAECNVYTDERGEYIEIDLNSQMCNEHGQPWWFGTIYCHAYDMYQGEYRGEEWANDDISNVLVDELYRALAALEYGGVHEDENVNEEIND